MMNHQPFETWNLDRSNLTPDQFAELKRHLETCPDCQRMYTAWECVQMEIKTAKLIEAPSGFTARFQSSLAARRANAQRQQTRKFLTILGISLLVILILLGVYVLTQSRPAEWIGSVIRVVAGIPFDIQELQYIAAFWLPQIPVYVWFLAAVIITAWLMVLVFTGTLTYRRYKRQGVLTK